MGWSTELFCNVSYNRKSYNFLYEVQEDLDEVNKGIRFCEDKLRMLATMTEPNKMLTLTDEDSSYIDEINCMFSMTMESLEEYYQDKFRLQLLLENWDTCHEDNGLAIAPPEGISWDKAYLYGDFVNSANGEADSEQE